MCGIAGVIASPQLLPVSELSSLAAAMGERLLHRGPDDSGLWADPVAGVAFSHRRLAVLDLSPQGHQPMLSACGRFVLAFNGEIYNHRQLRTNLEAVGGAGDWRGHSDTETFLAAVVHWGVAEALTRFVGMFAFALYDRRERLLHLGRDRMGEKPLYYGWAQKTFLFASEPKAFAACRFWPGEICSEALSLYLRYGYVPAPLSIFRRSTRFSRFADYHALRDLGRPRNVPLAGHSYWSLSQTAEAGLKNPFPGDRR